MAGKPPALRRKEAVRQKGESGQGKPRARAPRIPEMESGSGSIGWSHAIAVKSAYMSTVGLAATRQLGGH